MLGLKAVDLGYYLNCEIYKDETDNKYYVITFKDDKVFTYESSGFCSYNEAKDHLDILSNNVYYTTQM